MRSRSVPRLAVPAFTLDCPGYRDTDGGGALEFSIDGELRAAIGHADLIESWQEARALKPAELRKMTDAAASQLCRILESGLDTADLTEAVTDAAVVLLLAMKRRGISDPERIPPCTVMWHGQDARERVLLAE